MAKLMSFNRKGLVRAAIRSTVWVFSLLMSVFLAAQLANAQWTPLAHLNPGGSTQIMMQLTDGRVLVQAYDGSTWTILTPDATGSYVNGTWSFTGSSITPRYYYASQVLQNGKVWVCGGEYSGSPLTDTFTNTAEIYDPVVGTWSAAATFPQTHFGDDPSVLLTNNTILAGYISGPQTYFYNWATNTWTLAATKVHNDRSDEEGWARLGDGTVLTYDLFQSESTSGSYAEVFNPSANIWEDRSPSDGTSAGFIPQLSSSSTLGSELGPNLRLQNGNGFIIGATQNTALFNPSTNTWSAGPQILSGGAPFGGDDAPGAVLPNGNVLFAADAAPQYTTPFHAPTELFLYTPATNTITSIGNAFDPNLATEPSYPTRMLMLPTGQVLFSDDSAQLYVYTPTTGPSPLVRPIITNIAFSGIAGQFTLTGTKLNGQNAGATYGDDDQMDTDFPLVRLTQAGTGIVYYAKTTNWSRTTVGDATPETVTFTTPVGLPAGDYSVTEVGSGILSFPSALSINAAELP